MLRARMHADGASAAADEALRLLLEAGYGGDSAGMRAVLGAATEVALMCTNGHTAATAAFAASSSCTPAPWCGVVSTAIKVVRRATRRLRSSLQAAAPASRRQRRLPAAPGVGATWEARGAAVDARQSNMPLLAELLGLAASAAGALGVSSRAFIQALQLARISHAVSPAELHCGVPSLCLTRCAVQWPLL